MRILKLVLAFVAAVIVTTILGAAFHTQFVIGRLTDMGIAVSFADRLSTTLHDIAGMAPLFGLVIAGGFLVAFLAGALVFRFAGTQRNVVYAVAGAVADDLHLDVTRLFQILLDVDGVVAEGRARFRARRGQRHRKLVLRARHLHAAPAAAGRGLDDDGIADLGRDAFGLVFVADRALGAGHHRNA